MGRFLVWLVFLMVVLLLIVGELVVELLKVADITTEKQTKRQLVRECLNWRACLMSKRKGVGY